MCWSNISRVEGQGRGWAPKPLDREALQHQISQECELSKPYFSLTRRFHTWEKGKQLYLKNKIFSILHPISSGVLPPHVPLRKLFLKARGAHTGGKACKTTLLLTHSYLHMQLNIRDHSPQPFYFSAKTCLCIEGTKLGSTKSASRKQGERAHNLQHVGHVGWPVEKRARGKQSKQSRAMLQHGSRGRGVLERGWRAHQRVRVGLRAFTLTLHYGFNGF